MTMKKKYTSQNSCINNIKYGEGLKIVNPVNLYDCILGSNVFIGPFVEIQGNVIIGNNCKIQSHTFICSKVKISSNCFIGHGVRFINDDFKANNGPAKGNKKLWKNTTIGKNVSIGSGAIIMPITICAKTIIGAGSVVTKNINKAGIYAGNPAKLLKKIK